MGRDVDILIEVSDRALDLAWAKRRALDYIEAGDCMQAVMSLLSDMNKSDDLRPAIRGPLGMIGLQIACSDDLAETRRFIEGFR